MQHDRAHRISPADRAAARMICGAGGAIVGGAIAAAAPLFLAGGWLAPRALAFYSISAAALALACRAARRQGTGNRRR